MKRLLVLLILLLAVPAYAQQCSEDTQIARLTPAIVGGGVPAAAPAAFAGDILNETFDAAGYDNAVWTEIGSPDQDNTTNPPVGTATGFSGQALQISGSWADTYSIFTASSAGAVWYIRVRFYFAADSFTTSARTVLLFVDGGSNNSFYVNVTDPAGDGVFKFTTNGAGATAADTSKETFTTGESVELRLLLNDTSNIYSWYVDGEPEGENLTLEQGAANWLKMFVGAKEGSGYASFNYFVDDVDIDSSGFPTD